MQHVFSHGCTPYCEVADYPQARHPLPHVLSSSAQIQHKLQNANLLHFFQIAYFNVNVVGRQKEAVGQNLWVAEQLTTVDQDAADVFDCFLYEWVGRSGSAEAGNGPTRIFYDTLGNRLKASQRLDNAINAWTIKEIITQQWGISCDVGQRNEDVFEYGEIELLRLLD